MKNTHKQKMMSTIAVTLIATGFSALSPTLTPAMGSSVPRRIGLGGAVRRNGVGP
jgi:hypothetical protein